MDQSNAPITATEALRKQIEEQITAAMLAPRVTTTDVNSAIVSAQYHIFPGTTVTVCCITLRNGYTVVGESACVSKENFNEGIGREIAYENAREKIWQLLGYQLREDLMRGRKGSVELP